MNDAERQLIAYLSAADPDLRATAAAYVGDWLGFTLMQGQDGTHLVRILIAQLEHEDHPAVQDEVAHALLWGAANGIRLSEADVRRMREIAAGLQSEIATVVHDAIKESG